MNVSDDDLDLTDTESLLRALGRRFVWATMIYQTRRNEVRIYRENCDPVAVINNYYDSIVEAMESESDRDSHADDV